MAVGDIFRKMRGAIGNLFMVDSNNAAAVNLKNAAGVLELRNKADTAYAALSTSSLVVNDTNGQSVTFITPDLVANYTLTLPADDGTPGQVQATDGAGVLSWVTSVDTSACIREDTTTLAFGTASPLTLFTIPANATILTVTVTVDTAFTGTPTLSTGITGTTSKYTGTGDVDLKVAGKYLIEPALIAVGTTEALIATYSAGAAAAGSARIVVAYSVPS